MLDEQMSSSNLFGAFSIAIAIVGAILAFLVVNRKSYDRDEEARKELLKDEDHFTHQLMLSFQPKDSKEPKESQSDKDEAQAAQTDFASIWAVTQKRINYYHRIATNQARNSFISSQIATVVGFVIIVVFGVIAAQATSPAAAISAGAVGVVGGGLSAYIGSTFMKAQSEATAQLRQFFLQPVEFARLLGAERLIESLEPEERAQAVHRIVQGMMALPDLDMETKKKDDGLRT